MTESLGNKWDPLDEQKLVTGVVGKILDRVLTGGESAIRRAWANHKIKTQQGVSTYVERQLLRHAKIKNFLLRDKPVLLDDLFVEPALSSSGVPQSFDQLIETLSQLNRVLLIGSPGSGKTLLAKKVLIESLRKKDGFIPVFIELRQLPQFEEGTILGVMAATIKSSFPGFMPEQLVSGLEQGIFTIILDGFDEVDREKSKAVEAEILRISVRYPYLRMFISSRHMESLRGWNDFIVYRIEPQSLDTIIKIVERFPYQDAPKEKLIALLKSGELQQNINILQNPLLCLVLLPALRSRGNMVRAVDYFDGCIDTLIHIHDNAKELFERQWKAALGTTRLRQCVAALSFITYVENAYAFSYRTLREYVEATRDLVGFDFDTESFIYDITVNMALLEEVEFGYEFQYRQFQEYLAACYICALDAVQLRRALEGIASRQDTDMVFQYSHALNKTTIEQNWSVFVLRAPRIITLPSGRRTANQIQGTHKV